MAIGQMTSQVCGYQNSSNKSKIGNIFSKLFSIKALPDQCTKRAGLLVDLNVTFYLGWHTGDHKR